MKKYFVITILLLSSVYVKADDGLSPVIVPPPYIQTQPQTCNFSSVSITGQNGSINVPSAFIHKFVGNISLYNTYTYQSNILNSASSLNNDTLYGAFSFAPLEFLELSVGTVDSTSRVTAQQTLKYYGDLRCGVKVGYSIISQLSIAILGEVLTYSKTSSVDYAGYDGKATSYTLSFLASYDMLTSSLSFPMIANLRIGYLWDNTERLLTPNENNFFPPIGKYAMGIRGDNRTLLGVSVLFPFPQYFIEPILEFTSEFAGSYSSYALTDSLFTNVSFNQNPLYITPGIIFYTPINGLRLAIASQLSISKKITVSTGSVFVTPQTIWIAGISYSI